MSAGTRRHRLGLIIPSTNLTIERLLQRSAFGQRFEVEIVITRLKVTTISSTPDSRSHFQRDHLLEAARLLVDARPDVIAWAGTSSFWLGYAEEVEWMRAVGAELGIPITSATEAVMEALRERSGLARVSLYTPYETPIHEAVIATLGDAGFAVAHHQHLGITDNAAFADISPATIESGIRDFPDDDPVVIACTGIVGCIEDVDVIDSLVAVLWLAMELARRDEGSNDRSLDYRSVYNTLASTLAD